MNEAAPLAPTRHKLDVAAFYRMAEVGIHRQPSPDGYRDVTVHTTGTRLTLAADATISLDLDRLFG